MTKRVFAGLAVLLGGSFIAVAQETSSPGNFDPTFAFYRPEFFTTVDSTLLVQQLPIAEFLDGRLPGSTALGRMGRAPVANFTDIQMGLVSAQPRAKTKTASTAVKDPKDGKDYPSAEALAIEKASLTWTGGEIGFMYGHSAGKVSGDEFGTYIMGGVGNDHVQINAGASYQEFNGRVSRWRP